jgi:hypothetical protein
MVHMYITSLQSNKILNSSRYYFSYIQKSPIQFKFSTSLFILTFIYDISKQFIRIGHIFQLLGS